MKALKMKALNVKQPWAWLIANGYKGIEIRTWATRYRGPLLIVASKTKPPKRQLEAFHQSFPHARLQYGRAVCVAILNDCRPMTRADERPACCDLYNRAIAWHLWNIRKVPPFAVKGQLGLYDVSLPSATAADEVPQPPAGRRDQTEQNEIAQAHGDEYKLKTRN